MPGYRYGNFTFMQIRGDVFRTRVLAKITGLGTGGFKQII